jgi:hypothetical protein
VRRGLVPFAVAALTVAVVGVALARARVVHEDPNDTPGRMDVWSVTVEASARPRWVVELQKPWRAPGTWDRAFLFVYLDVAGDPRGDYYALIRSTGTKLVGSLWRDPKLGRDLRVRGLTVERVSPRRVGLRIPLSAMDVGPFRTTYRWWVVTTYTDEVCRKTCIDRVPDTDAVEEYLPGASPTPTATSVAIAP